MEFTDADIVESCREGKIGHTWGFVNDYRDRGWAIGDKHAIAAYKNGLLRAYVMKEHAKKLSGIIKAPTECYVENVSDSGVWVRIEAF